MGGVINSSVGRPAFDVRSSSSTQYGNLNTPKLDFAASDVWRKVGSRSRAAVSTRTGFTMWRRPSAVRSTRGDREFRHLNVKVDYNADLPPAHVRSGRVLREERDNAKKSTFDRRRRRATIRPGSPPAAACDWSCRIERPPGDCVRRRLDVPRISWRCQTRSPARSDG